MANVLLIKTSPFKSTKGEAIPLGLLYLSGALKKSGHQTDLIDFASLGKNDYKHLDKTIGEFKAEIIGITCNTHERFSVIEMANYIKSHHPEIITVVGGPHITLMGEEMMKSCSSIDVGIIEDGENIIVEIANNHNNIEKIKKIPGIYYHQSGQVCHNDIVGVVTDLDAYGHPDLDIINKEEYSLVLPVKGGLKAISICTSRGCPYQCNFCAATKINFGRVRYHSAQWIFDEVKRCLDKYGSDYAIFFYDDHFLLNKKRIFEFCRLVKESGLKFQWGCYTRVDVIDDEVLKNIKEIGCVMLTFGIESGSNKILKLMNKKVNRDKIISVIKKVKTYGIKTRGSFIFGYPQENLFDILATFWMILKSDFEISELVFSKYTLLYPKTEIARFLPPDFDWHRDYPETEIEQLFKVPVYVPRFDLLRRRFTLLLFLIYKYYKKLKRIVLQ